MPHATHQALTGHTPPVGQAAQARPGSPSCRQYPLLHLRVQRNRSVRRRMVSTLADGTGDSHTILSALPLGTRSTLGASWTKLACSGGRGILVRVPVHEIVANTTLQRLASRRIESSLAPLACTNTVLVLVEARSAADTRSRDFIILRSSNARLYGRIPHDDSQLAR
jgi:hypothetical protein